MTPPSAVPSPPLRIPPPPAPAAAPYSRIPPITAAPAAEIIPAAAAKAPVPPAGASPRPGIFYPLGLLIPRRAAAKEGPDQAFPGPGLPFFLFFLRQSRLLRSLAVRSAGQRTLRGRQGLLSLKRLAFLVKILDNILPGNDPDKALLVV